MLNSSHKPGPEQNIGSTDAIAAASGSMYLATKSSPTKCSRGTWHHGVCRIIMTPAALHNLLVWSSPAKLSLPHPLSVNSATKVFLVSTHLLCIADEYIKALLNTGNVPSTKPVKQDCNHYCHGSNDKWPKASSSFASSAHLALPTNG